MLWKHPDSTDFDGREDPEPAERPAAAQPPVDDHLGYGQHGRRS